jgi:hypothetical protein
MTNAQKKALAYELMQQAGNMVEFRSEILTEGELEGVDSDEIRDQLWTWLKRLPHDFYDTRLG